MVRGYEIIVDGEAVAGMTKCDEGERGNKIICELIKSLNDETDVLDISI